MLWFRKKKDKKPKIRMDDFKPVRLTVKSVVMYELMTGKSYYGMDQGDLLHLLYCAYVCSEGTQITYDAFQTMIQNERFAMRLGSDMRRLESFSLQFNRQEEVKEDGGKKKDGDEKLPTVGDIVNVLTFRYGLSIEYLMDMDLWQLTWLLKGASQEYENEMEDKRFWTYMQMSPHIDLKKVKSPEKLLPFPWEKDKNRKKVQSDVERESKFKATFGMTLDLRKEKPEEDGGRTDDSVG